MSKKSDPCLAEVQKAFAHWRRHRPTRRTPLWLREQAVGLLAHHRVTEVMKALQLDHRRLSRWRRELETATAPLTVSGFVELPSAPRAEGVEPRSSPSVRLTLTRQAADGRSVSLAGELSAAQWRWALGLLQETEV